MQLTDALDQARQVLDRIRGYTQAHKTFETIEQLNREYVPERYQDDVDWLADALQRLADADPNDGSDQAVAVAPAPSH